MQCQRGTKRSRGRSTDFILRVIGDDVVLTGNIEHVHSGHAQEFRSCVELIHLIQGKLEELGKPQCACELRTWAAADREWAFGRGKSG